MRRGPHIPSLIVGVLSAWVGVAIAATLNDDDGGTDESHFTCDAAMANAYGPNGWQITCIDEHGAWVQFEFGDPLPPEATPPGGGS